MRMNLKTINTFRPRIEKFLFSIPLQFLFYISTNFIILDILFLILNLKNDVQVAYYN